MLIFFKRTILTLSIFIFISLLSYSHSEDQDLKEILESIQKDIKTLERAVYAESFQDNSENQNNNLELDQNSEEVLTRHLLKLSEIEKEVDVFKGILTDENELNYFFRNPIYVTADQEKVFLKVCEKLKLSNEFKNTVLLMISKGRSYDLVNFTKDFLKLCSIDKNELALDIRTAKEISKQNMEDIITVVQQVTKKSIKINRNQWEN